MTGGPRHVFGPVMSRRLGRSLGVDLVPLKTCSFNCIYCQLGRTACPTLNRREYVPFNEVVEDIATALAHGPSPDYVTLSGSGEPTLYLRIGDAIRAIRDLTDTPIAVLTNGSLLSDQSVRRACALADVVLPTLAAADDATYRRVHRPASGLTFTRHVAGLRAFHDQHGTPIWLELFLLDFINTRATDRQRFAELIEQIRPERVQLNTAVRPTSEPFALSVSAETLHEWVAELGPVAQVTADVAAPTEHILAPTDSDVLALCQRRPSTLEQIAATFGIHRCEAVKNIGRLREAKLIRVLWRPDGQYFTGAQTNRSAPADDRASDRTRARRAADGGIDPPDATSRTAGEIR